MAQQEAWTGLTAATIGAPRSLAVSVKMNILLFAPGLLLVYLASLGLWNTVGQLAICGSVQVSSAAHLRRPARAKQIRMRAHPA